MDFPDLDALLKFMQSLGAGRVLCKQLAENDNSKQQIYLGGSFDVLKLLPFQQIRDEPGIKRPNFKAGLHLNWISPTGAVEPALGAQLILYPDYPEVRLSGFLRGCSLAPSAMMQPVPRDQRKHNNGPDGRVLFLGTGPGGQVFAFLAARGTAVAKEVEDILARGAAETIGVFHELRLGSTAPRALLINRLRAIHKSGWHASRRLNSKGESMPYAAQNGGGYTLEALLGVRPNSEAGPDFMGWEVKAFGQDRITLMTPEPDSGFYGKHGVEAFLRKYGRPIRGDTIYFTGTHKVGVVCPASRQTLQISGFDATTSKMVNVTGGIQLVDGRGVVSAMWTFAGLIAHWGRKHMAAAYVPYTKRMSALMPQYMYESPALLGEETEFARFLLALSRGQVIYDPGSKIEHVDDVKSRVKARSQFRISIRHLSELYAKFEAVQLD